MFIFSKIIYISILFVLVNGIFCVDFTLAAKSRTDAAIELTEIFDQGGKAVRVPQIKLAPIPVSAAPILTKADEKDEEAGINARTECNARFFALITDGFVEGYDASKFATDLSSKANSLTDELYETLKSLGRASQHIDEIYERMVFLTELSPEQRSILRDAFHRLLETGPYTNNLGQKLSQTWADRRDISQAVIDVFQQGRLNEEFIDLCLPFCKGLNGLEIYHVLKIFGTMNREVWGQDRLLQIYSSLTEGLMEKQAAKFEFQEESDCGGDCDDDYSYKNVLLVRTPILLLKELVNTDPAYWTEEAVSDLNTKLLQHRHTKELSALLDSLFSEVPTCVGE